MKKILSALAITLAIGLDARASVNIIPATGGLNIPGNTAADGISPAWTTLSSITVQEAQNQGNGPDDFKSGNNKTWVLKAPAGFEFNTSVKPSLSFTANRDITSASVAMTDSSTVTITWSVAAENKTDSFIIGGATNLQVRPTSAIASASGYINRRGGSASFDGFSTTTNASGSSIDNLAHLSETPQQVPSALSIQTPPSSVNTAGVPFGTQPVIRIRDQFNQPITFDNNTIVTAARFDGNGTLQGTVSAQAVNGLVTFSDLYHTVAGTMTIRFTSGSLSNVTSQSITINPNTAATLVFTAQPGNATVGLPFGSQPAILAKDVYGNNSSVGLGGSHPVTISSTNGTLLGTTTVDIGTTFGNGSWTFTDLRLDVIGDNQLTTSSSALSSASSDSFTVAQGAQTISFGTLADKTFGDASFDVSASASSGLPVSFGVTGPATISGNTITITGVGTVTVTASQAGDTNWFAASDVQQQFNVVKANQTIDFGTLSDKTFGDGSFDVSATATPSGLPVSFGVTGPATISGNTITITGVGTVTVTASQSGDDNYNPASDVQQQFNVVKANQAINFGTLSDKTFGDGSFDVSATTTPSGLPVSFVVTGPATISGNTITITGAGTVTVTASQTGNENYNAASDVQQQFNVGKASQTINFGALSGKTFGDPAFDVSATATPSGLPVSFGVTGPATISGSTITITGTGTVVVTASQSGDTNYNAASDVQQQFDVAAQGQTITFDSLTNKVYGDAPFAISATASSGLPVSFFVDGPASFDGTNITILGAGTVTVTASQAGDSSFSAAQNVVQQFEVAKADQTITFAPIPDKGNADGPFSISASSDSGLTVQFGISGPAMIDSNNIVSITGTGLVTITASQPGDTNYNAALDVVHSFNVTNSVTAPLIDAQPGDLSVITGFPANFGVGVSGTEPLSFQWMFNGTNIDGATNATFTIPFVKLSDAGAYSVQIGNGGGNVLSSNAILTVLRMTNDINLDGRADLFVQNTNDNTLALWNLEGTNFYSSILLNNGEPLTAGWRLAAQADFDHDGNTDLVFQNGGFVTIWFMNGTNLDHSVALNTKAISKTWKVIAAHDFDHNGSVDILFQKDSGYQAVWLMDGTTIKRSVLLRGGAQVPTSWKLVGVDDFNQDGSVDLLWQNNRGKIAVWGFDGLKLKSVNVIPGGLLPAQGWRIVGLVDLNGDGTRDIVWQNTKDGRLFTWFLDRLNQIGSSDLIGGESLPPGWTVVGER